MYRVVPVTGSPKLLCATAGARFFRTALNFSLAGGLLADGHDGLAGRDTGTGVAEQAGGVVVDVVLVVVVVIVVVVAAVVEVVVDVVGRT
jgi:hypothetical protein